MKKQKTRFENSAFTIVEILLVVMLIALLAGAGGGIYIGTYKRTLVRNSARDFFLAAKYARSLAIERQSRYRILLDVEKKAFLLTIEQFNEFTGLNEQQIIKDMYFRPKTLPGDVKFENIIIESTDYLPDAEQDEKERESQKSIVFSPDGTAQTAVIQFGDDKSHYTVVISAATGKVKVHSGTSEKIKSGIIDLDKSYKGD